MTAAVEAPAVDYAAVLRAQLAEGAPVMACRCGAGLRWSQMRRPREGRKAGFGRAALVEPIVCPPCAEKVQ